MEAVTITGHSGPVKAGTDPIVLECQVTGAVPTATIEWTENGSVLSGEDGTTLSVPKTVGNSGNAYGCRAYNDLDTTGKSDEVTIDVRGEICPFIHGGESCVFKHLAC